MTREKLCFILLITQVLVLGHIAQAIAAPEVRSVAQQTTTVGRYDILEISADVQTTATNLYWPYDPSPPPSIPPGAGVSVDGLFSNDNWLTTVTMPGFYYQACDRRLVTGNGQNYTDEWVYPVGSPKWMIRFAPPALGNWKYKVRVQDASGTTTYPSSGDLAFECVSSLSRGFVRPSSTDSRYFEMSDGTALNSIGVTMGFHTTYEADSMLNTLGTNGVKTVRTWMSYRGWQNPFAGGPGMPQWVFLSMSGTGGSKSGDRYCAVVAAGANTRQSVYLTRDCLYRLKGSMRADNVGGGQSTGAFAYIGSDPTTPSTVTSAIQGSQGWMPFSLDYQCTTSGQYWVGCKHTGSGGTAYFDDLSLQESQDSGQMWTSDLLSKSDFDFENYVDQAQAWRVDHIFQQAKDAGVYLKPVITEKQDFCLGSIQPDGSTGTQSDNNFYASEQHPSRWLQKTWWRYMSARWGSYTSLHSWELCNEGDPLSGNHQNAANALARYVHSVSPYRNMCTTSFWHSIPMDFWKNSDCDYIDVHEYFGPSTASTGSHGPRYYAWSDGMLPPDNNESWSLSFDTAEKHSGTRSMKVVSKPGSANAGRVHVVPEYHVGIDPSHSYTVRYWAKGNSLANPGGAFGWSRPGINICWSAAYHENDFISEGVAAPASLGTYDWHQYVQTGIRPPVNANTANLCILTVTNLSASGTFWVDDVEFIDETSGKSLFVDGGFDGERIDYDSALAVRKYGVLLNSYGLRAAKPVIWAETGIRGANVYGNPYKGYSYTEENQQLVDDTGGIYIKKMVWAHVGPDNPNMLYWWNDIIVKKGLWGYFKAFQSFVAGIPVSNGNYKDASATTSATALRAWGQKDLTNNRAHLWIDNAPYTWKSVVDGVNVPAVAGTVTVPGLKDGAYKVEWWDTSTGAITKTEERTCTGGNLVLSVQSLQSDIACRIAPTQAKIDMRVTVPSLEVVPGQTVTITLEYTNTGETEAKNVTVTARVPAEMDYVAGSAEESGGAWNPDTKSVLWVIDTVLAKTTGSRTFRARVR